MVAESVLLLAMRWWMADRHAQEDPWPRLRAAFRRVGAEAATPIVDPLMELIAHTARRGVIFNPPREAFLSDDEQRLLAAASLSQAVSAQPAIDELHPELLSAAGARIVTRLLEDLGETFADAGLLFRARIIH